MWLASLDVGWHLLAYYFISDHFSRRHRVAAWHRRKSWHPSSTCPVSMYCHGVGCRLVSIARYAGIKIGRPKLDRRIMPIPLNNTGIDVGQRFSRFNPEKICEPILIVICCLAGGNFYMAFAVEGQPFANFPFVHFAPTISPSFPFPELSLTLLPCPLHLTTKFQQLIRS